jgi:hypothetical protein
VCVACLGVYQGIGVARAETDLCKRLKEISSRDPTKEVLWGLEPPERICRGLYWLEFRPLPLSRILTGADLANYRSSTTGHDCTTAVALLSNGFAAAHPKALSILTDKENFKSWKRRTVGKNFPALALCFGLEEVREAQAEIDRLGISANPYAGHEKSMASEAARNLPIPVRERHNAIFGLHIDLMSTKSPDIAMALLKLSVAGMALKYHELYELYLAFRLRIRGENDPILRQIIDRPIDKNLWAQIKRRANAGNYKDMPIYPGLD